MISIIICSRQKHLSQSCADNMRDTVGCEYELICIDNSEKRLSIFEAYNLGLKKAVYDLVCFQHDDAIYLTENWGNVIIEIFNSNQNIGVLGVAGSRSKSTLPSVWWHCPPEHKIINIVQLFPNNLSEHWFQGFSANSNLVEVTVCDGVFFVMKKSTDISFDETFTGFHNYDIDISLQFKQKGYRNYVTSDLLLKHYSLGSINEDWINSTMHLFLKYKSFLGPEFMPQNNSQEKKNGVWFIEKCLEYNKVTFAWQIYVHLVKTQPAQIFNVKLVNFFLKKAIALF